MQKTKYTSIDEYINQFPLNVQEILQNLRTAIKNAAPQASEAIAYDMPTFKLKNKNLIHFAAFKNHIGVYGISPDLEPFKKELEQYFYPKSTIRFQLNEPIPYHLIKKIIEHKISQS